MTWVEYTGDKAVESMDTDNGTHLKRGDNRNGADIK
jgi:hypothetical protein